jgi:site-specific recombinase XerD
MEFGRATSHANLRNPIKDFSSKWQKNNDPKPVPEATLDSLLGGITDLRGRTLMTFFLASGFRVSEIQQLDRDRSRSLLRLIPTPVKRASVAPAKSLAREASADASSSMRPPFWCRSTSSVGPTNFHLFLFLTQATDVHSNDPAETSILVSKARATAHERTRLRHGFATRRAFGCRKRMS